MSERRRPPAGFVPRNGTRGPCRSPCSRRLNGTDTETHTGVAGRAQPIGAAHDETPRRTGPDNRRDPGGGVNLARASGPPGLLGVACLIRGVAGLSPFDSAACSVSRSRVGDGLHVTAYGSRTTPKNNRSASTWKPRPGPGPCPSPVRIRLRLSVADGEVRRVVDTPESARCVFVRRIHVMAMSTPGVDSDH